MKLGRVAKFDNRNKKKRQKKIDDDAMSPNFDAIVIFPIYGQFGARKPDSERIVCKTYIFYNSELLSFKN